MDTQIEEIKAKIDIVEFIGSYVQVKKTGRNFKACCPFHNEKTPSFVISPDRQIWHCFGSCGDGGDVIRFLMKWENITFFEALKELALRANVQLKDVSFEDKEWNNKERIIKINYLTSEFYQYILHQTSFGKKGLDYLSTRAINPQIMKTFGLGYAPSSWDSLLKFLKKKGFKESELFEAGVVIKSERGSYYDRFRGRLMFPIKDIKGNIIGFSGRLLENDDKAAKYMNTPETPIYHKRESLFGIHLAKDAIRKENNVLLVEGEFDMITPYEKGIENVVAIKGSAVTAEQLQILKRYTNRVTLALDSDAAGEEAIKRGISEAEKQEFEIQIVQFTNGKDPDEAARNDFITFKKALKSPILIYDFLIQLAQNKHPGNTPFAKKNISDEVMPFIGNIKNPIVQSHYIKVLTRLLDVSEESLQQVLKKQKFTAKPRRSFIKKSTEQIPREELMQKYLFSCMLQSEHVYQAAESVFQHMQPSDFTLPALQKVAEAFLIFKNQHSTFDQATFFSSLPPEIRSTADEIYLFASSSLEYKEHDLQRVAVEVKRHSIKTRLGKLLESDQVSQENDKEIQQLSQQLKDLEKKLKGLYN